MKNIEKHKSLFAFVIIAPKERPEIFVVALVCLVTIFPHPPNVSPIGALGLFVGTYLERKLYLLVPVAVALIADLVTTGLYTFTVLFFVYLGHFSSSIIGRTGIR